MSGLYASSSAGGGELPGIPSLPPGTRPGPDDFVVTLSGRWARRPDVRQVIDRAARLGRAAGAAAVVPLDWRGEEVPGFRMVRGATEPSGPMSAWYPFVLEEEAYDPDAHRAEAETYRDRIGDRLMRPDAVDQDKRHLIADDHQRAARVLELGYEGFVLDVGTSDGTLLLQTVRRWDLSGAVGVDVARSAIEEAQAAVAREPFFQSRVEFLVAFIEDLTFPDGAFDTISACETLEHIGAGVFDGALRNLMRMLRPGGRFLMTVPNRYPARRYEAEGRARWSWPAHHQFFTECKVRHLLAPLFETVQFVSLYEGEKPGESIYLICQAVGRR